MATIGSLSATTSANLYGAKIKGFGGLASGLDTDSLIESMTAGTRAKIAKQLQSKQRTQWEMDACRSISDKLIQFSKKYVELSGSTSLYRESFFDRNQITMSGDNSRFLSINGGSAALENVSIVGVKQMARDANLMTNHSSTQILSGSRGIDFSGRMTALNNANINISYNGKTYSVQLPSGPDYDYTSQAGVIQGLTKGLQKVRLEGGGTLADKIGVSASSDGSGGNFTFTALNASDNISITGGNQDALKLMGFMDQAGKLKGDGKITASGLTGDRFDNAQLYASKSMADYVNGKSLVFSLNGETKTIKLNTAGQDWATDGGASLVNTLNNQLKDAYGPGRVTASLNGGKLEFQVNNSSGSGADPSAVLKITGADAGLIGSDGVLGIDYGASNRLNMGVSLKDSGLDGLNLSDLGLTINGTAINVNATDTLADVMYKINNSGAGVQVSYLETADRLVFTSEAHGQVGNNIEISGGLADTFFGGPGTHTLSGGQDAILTVRYNGNEATDMDLTRSTNTFNLEGATVTINGKFGFNETTDGSGNITYTPDNSIPVSFKASVNSDKITDTVASMIEEYNALVEMVNKEAGTKPNRDYPPLTDEQKAEMSEDEIEKWNEKAQAGILFNDSLVRGLADRLRTVFSGVTSVGNLAKMGITISDQWQDNGKISFDEDKFRAALAEDPDKVKDLFSKAKDDNSSGGFMARMKDICYDYANTVGVSKGSLLVRAGSTSAASSLTDNMLQKRMDEIDKYVKELKSKLQSEIDRYTKQFSTLEQLVSQMNSQSSWLSQSMGG